MRQLTAALFSATMAVAGFLLFQVQPILAKFILPWFGGSATTWTVCMLFFQTALLLGYAYAYLATRPLTLRAQAVLQILLIAGACLLLPITPAESWKPVDSADPIGRIVGLLALSVGAPTVVLSTTSPLLQRWLGQVDPAVLASRYFAISNFGSFAGLLSYPLLVEPFLPSLDQTRLWSDAFYLYAVLAAGCALVVFRSGRGRPATAAGPAEPTCRPGGAGRGLLWLGYSALGSVLLLATTNTITQWSAVVPFLWVAPLSAYLLTFVFCFGYQTARLRWLWLLALLAATLGDGLLAQPEVAEDVLVQAGLQCAMLFFGCMICHGEIVRLQPPARGLPGFYLVVALGGALGGAFVTFLAPLLFADYWEHPLSVAATAAAALWIEGRLALRADDLRRRLATAASAGLFLLAGVGLGRGALADAAVTIERVRNFYGSIKIYVEDKGDPEWESLVMQQAGVDQGSQFQAPARRSVLFCAYDRGHALGLALRFNQKRRAAGPDTPLRIGVIGLGAGMVAGLASPGDSLRYYELNPAVPVLAAKYFTFLADSPGRAEIVLGDGRLSLEREARAGRLGQFDLLVLNAFRGAAPPMHLMTKEAFDLYLRHLAPQGILVVNFELDTLELSPLHRGLAAAEGLEVHWFETKEQPGCEDAVSWAVYTRDAGFWEVPEVKAAVSPWRDKGNGRLVWTDADSNLLSVINWNGDD